MSQASPLTRLTRLTRLSLLLFSTGCVYYNGLYNAKTFARRAERAEREGRTFDAQALWGQVVIKADTVLARHPRSKWAGEARYYRAKGLVGAGDCVAAVPVLRQVVSELRDPALADDAALALSGCEGQLGNLAAAGFAVERLIDDPDPVRRDEARWRTGAAYRLSGRTDEAVRILQTTAHPRARGELAAALAQAGAVPQAVALADSLLVAPDTLAPWGTILTALGTADVAAGSALLDRVLPLRSWVPDTAATWLAADAGRLMGRDTARALARYEAAYALAPDRPAGLGARITALRHRLVVTEAPPLLDSVVAELADLSPNAGEAVIAARALVVTAGRLRVRIDSFAPAAPQGDLRGFLLGEALRDSLGAPRLAAMVWRRVVTERPESPYLPKILLAIAGPDSVARSELSTRLAAQYPTNPYVAVLLGTGDAGYQALEDSLFRFARTQRQLDRPARPPVRTNRPQTPPSQSAPVQ